MDEESLPLKMLGLCLPGRRKKGRPRNSWTQEATTDMREKGINNMEWVDREERWANVVTLHINKQIYIH